MADQEAGEAWSLAFAGPGATGGFLRLVRWPAHAWFWAYLVAPDVGLVVVRDHDLVPPRGATPVVRADGLWCELIEETPEEHWTIGLEAFGVRLDDPLDAERGERGERLPAGLDVEWERGAGPYGVVHGLLLAGAARIDVDATGTFEHTTVSGNPWAAAGRQVTWQRDAAGGTAAQGDAVTVDVDGAGLPVAVRADDAAFAVEATAIVPTPRVVLALLDGSAGRGWLEWRQGAPSAPGP